ncbi:hypothetical protein SNEBB_003596 [Seison nebaliae]|nr:hypothetical protein SNEBB_003596 [Seison nebaliae]
MIKFNRANKYKPEPFTVPNTIKRTISKKSIKSSKKKGGLPKVESNINLDSSGFSKYGAQLPMKTSMERIKKNVMKYLNPAKLRKSFYPRNLEKHEVCDTPIEAVYYGYKYTKELGSGAQGAVYLMNNGTHDLALKRIPILDNFLIQINALAASTRNNRALKLLGIMEGLSEKNNKIIKHKQHNVITADGRFCYAMSYVPGKQLINFNFKELGSGKDPGSYRKLKINYKLIILILRQLQILHFSFNEYPVQTQSPIYGAYSFTMSHGDLHRSNIIVQKRKKGNYANPTTGKWDEKNNLIINNLDKIEPANPNILQLPMFKKYMMAKDGKSFFSKFKSNVNLGTSTFGNCETELPMTTSMDTIKTNVMRYLNPSKHHQTFHPNDLEKHLVCDIPYTAKYHGYKYLKLLGAGAQGEVTLMGNGTHLLALKRLIKLDNFLIQINALAASTRNNGPLKLLGTMEGFNHMDDEVFSYESQHVNSRNGRFCYAMTYIRGKELKQIDNLKELGSGKTIFSYRRLKINYKLIILILRQLQRLHFSFNEYPLQTESPIYGAYSFTMSHGDLHRSNIIVQKQLDNTYVPILVDVGFNIYYGYYDHNEIFIQFYNKYLLEESFIGDRKGLVVHKLQLVNSQQNEDFCMLLGGILMSFMGVKRNIPINCRSLRQPLKFTTDRHLYQRLTVWKTGFIAMEGILTILQKLLSPLNIYLNTWVPLYNYLQNFD